MNHPSDIAGVSFASLLTRTELLDHAKHPRNRGVLEAPDVIQEEANPLCGDVVTIYAKVEAAGSRQQATGSPISYQLSATSFTGHGCLISQAAASMLTEHVVGKRTEEILRMERANIEQLLGSSLSPSRVKCALLPLIALKNGIQQWESEVGGGELGTAANRPVSSIQHPAS